MPAPKILVVDDQPINVQLLKRKLEKSGINVTTAYNGHDALLCVEADKPDLILLDVMMPDMDGIEVCQRLQASENSRSIPIIFVTARNSKDIFWAYGEKRHRKVELFVRAEDREDARFEIRSLLLNARFYR